MEPLRLITPPAAEPVTLASFKNLLRFDATDSSWDPTLSLYLTAARESVENCCRIALVTQTWLWRLDSFPSVPLRYDRNGYPQILLPKPPFQSIDSFVYVDTSGTVQTLTRDPSYGVNLAAPFYGYQLEPGGGIMPAGLTPPWARPWPPQRMVPANVTIQFRCGYGGPLTVSMAANSPALTAAGFTFNPDDAPQIEGDAGTKICIPSASLTTNVASVDDEGNATLAAAPAAIVTDQSAWLGNPVPNPLVLAILFQAQFFFEKGGVSDQVNPRVIDSLRNSGYRNLVS
jgi:hypothetical protein